MRKYVLVAFWMLPLFSAAQQNASAASKPQPAYASVNGLKMYYETLGEGEPVILLHGGLSASEMFRSNLQPFLSKSRKVISVDLQAHGRTADINRAITYENMADDVAGLIASMGYQRAHIIGYSLGGGVALQLAVRHPAIVKKLVLISTPFKRSGWFPEISGGMAEMNRESAYKMKDIPPYHLYHAVAPRPHDWPVLVEKVGNLLRQNYDWSDKISGIAAAVLLVYADADSIPISHMNEFFALLGGGLKDAGWDGSARPKSKLAILPGSTHYDIFSSPVLEPVLQQFLSTSNDF